MSEVATTSGLSPSSQPVPIANRGALSQAWFDALERGREHAGRNRTPSTPNPRQRADSTKALDPIALEHNLGSAASARASAGDRNRPPLRRDCELLRATPIHRATIRRAERKPAAPSYRARILTRVVVKHARFGLVVAFEHSATTVRVVVACGPTDTLRGERVANAIASRLRTLRRPPTLSYEVLS